MKNPLLKRFGLFVLFWLVGGGVLLAQNLNLALGKVTTASSLESSSYPASYATDGQQGTRWSSEFTDNQALVVNLGSVQTIDRVRISWEVAYGRDFVLQVSNDAANWTTVQTVTANAPTLRNNQYVNEFSNLNRAGTSIGSYVRLFGAARATQYGFSVSEFEVFSFSNTAFNLADGKPSSASSTEASFVPALAFDGDENTRWSTLGISNQALDVDLQGRATISRFYLNWELAYGVNFRLQVSDDRVTWTTFATYSNNQAYYNEAAVIASGRYVRMQGDDGGQNSGGFSIWELRLFGTTEPLPVSLLSFTAVAQGPGVAVSWATATEQHNVGFEVQRSADGTTFGTLAKVAGAGNSQTIKRYQYTDARPLATTAYYRLRQLDQDGQATYGPVVTVQPLARALATVSVYPNPTADQATVEWEAAAARAARWSLTNSTGQVVATGTLAAQPGHNAQAIDLRAHAAGSYVLSVETDGQVLGRQRLQKN